MKCPVKLRQVTLHTANMEQAIYKKTNRRISTFINFLTLIPYCIVALCHYNCEHFRRIQASPTYKLPETHNLYTYSLFNHAVISYFHIYYISLYIFNIYFIYILYIFI